MKRFIQENHTANINLEGIVLHSPNIDKLSVFYESLLGITFKENISQNKRHFVGKLDTTLYCTYILYLLPNKASRTSRTLHG